MNEFLMSIGIDQSAARELVNGMWYVLGLEMLLSLVSFLVASYYQQRRDGFQRLDVTIRSSWYVRSDVQLAISLSCYLVGSTMRAGWVWWLLECQNDYGADACRGIEQAYSFMILAAMFAITGGVCSIRVMLPRSWSPWSWMTALVIAVGVPVAFRYWVV